MVDFKLSQRIKISLQYHVTVFVEWILVCGLGIVLTQGSFFLDKRNTGLHNFRPFFGYMIMFLVYFSTYVARNKTVKPSSNILLYAVLAVLNYESNFMLFIALRDIDSSLLVVLQATFPTFMCFFETVRVFHRISPLHIICDYVLYITVLVLVLIDCTKASAETEEMFQKVTGLGEVMQSVIGTRKHLFSIALVLLVNILRVIANRVEFIFKSDKDGHVEKLAFIGLFGMTASFVQGVAFDSEMILDVLRNGRDAKFYITFIIFVIASVMIYQRTYALTMKSSPIVNGIASILCLLVGLVALRILYDHVLQTITYVAFAFNLIAAIGFVIFPIAEKKVKV